MRLLLQCNYNRCLINSCEWFSDAVNDLNRSARNKIVLFLYYDLEDWKLKNRIIRENRTANWSVLDWLILVTYTGALILRDWPVFLIKKTEIQWNSRWIDYEPHPKLLLFIFVFLIFKYSDPDDDVLFSFLLKCKCIAGVFYSSV